MTVLANFNCCSQTKNVRVIGNILDTTFITTTKELRSDIIPQQVFMMTHLKHLSIQGGDCDYRVLDEKGNDVTECWGISEIPPQIGDLKELVSLSLQVNAIAGIPKEIAQLQNLRSVDLSDNLPLKDINYLCELRNLEELSLCGCNISILPARIGELKKLKTLCLVGTKVDAAESKRIKRLLPKCRILF